MCLLGIRYGSVCNFLCEVGIKLNGIDIVLCERENGKKFGDWMWEKN